MRNSLLGLLAVESIHPVVSNQALSTHSPSSANKYKRLVALVIVIVHGLRKGGALESV
jgi:hypothetical protein